MPEFGRAAAALWAADLPYTALTAIFPFSLGDIIIFLPNCQHLKIFWNFVETGVFCFIGRIFSCYRGFYVILCYKQPVIFYQS